MHSGGTRTEVHPGGTRAEAQPGGPGKRRTQRGGGDSAEIGILTSNRTLGLAYDSMMSLTGRKGSPG